MCLPTQAHTHAHALTHLRKPPDMPQMLVGSVNLNLISPYPPPKKKQKKKNKKTTTTTTTTPVNPAKKKKKKTTTTTTPVNPAFKF